MVGHPQVYCRVLASILIEEGHQVVIAGSGTTENWVHEFSDLVPLLNQSQVQFENTRLRSAGGGQGLVAEELIQLQKDFSIDSTLFVEGDYFADQFRRIAEGEASRLIGRNVAIFSLTASWCPGEDGYTGKKLPVFGPTVRQTLGRLKRAVFNNKDSERYFYESVLCNTGVVDSLVVKDERITEKYGPPVYWMPEIYRVFDDASENEKKAEWQHIAEPIRGYMQKAGADNVLLYFGTGTWYKGYDYFLKLAELDPTSFAVHAGAPERPENKAMSFDTKALRQTLRQQGRLFETNAFVENQALVDYLFNSIERFVSTHRLTLSSGTMLQALEAGKPVLVPGTGLVGWRTEKFGLGKTYRYLNEQDLALAWKAFRQEPFMLYEERIRDYMKRFSRDAVRSFFLERLCL